MLTCCVVMQRLSVRSVHMLWHVQCKCQHPSKQQHVTVQDVQSLFAASAVPAALSEKFLALQNAAGITTKLVNPRASGIKTITLSGWAALVAMLSLIAVIVGSVYLGYRRWFGVGSDYAMVSKSGDV